MTKLTMGTFCSGIGAPEVAAEGIFKPIWFSEIDPFPSEVLAHHWPDVPNLGDMTDSDIVDRIASIGIPDLVVAGLPCQPFSIAGLRNGEGDERNLTSRFVEIIHAINDIRVAAGRGAITALIENVPGLLSDKGNAFGCFLGGLVGAVDALPPPGDGSWPGEGMVQGPRARAAWAVLDAQWFGVAQRRRRVFVVVDFGGACDPAKVLLEPDSLRGDTPPRRETGEGAAGNAGAGVGSGKPTFGTLMANAGTKQWLGNQEALSGDYHIVQRPVAFDCKGTEVQTDTTGVMPSLRSMGHHNSHQNPGGHAAIAIQERACAEDLSTGPQGSGYRTDDCAYTLEARNKVQSVAVTGQTTHALTAEGHDASEDGTGRGTPVVAFAENQQGAVRAADVVPALSIGGGKPGQGYPPIFDTPSVRRLMPIECARLQGFPDDHTAITYRGKPAADGPQYKAYGNSMAVPVIRWILKRMQP